MFVRLLRRSFEGSLSNVTNGSNSISLFVSVPQINPEAHPTLGERVACATVTPHLHTHLTRLRLCV